MAHGGQGGVLRKTWVSLHLDFFMTQVDESSHGSIEDSLLGCGSRPSLRGTGEAADHGTREQEHLSSILMHEVSQLLTVHLEHRVFSLRVQPKPNSTE
jgi:hypothetical protein